MKISGARVITVEYCVRLLYVAMEISSKFIRDHGTIKQDGYNQMLSDAQHFNSASRKDEHSSYIVFKSFVRSLCQSSKVVFRIRLMSPSA